MSPLVRRPAWLLGLVLVAALLPIAAAPAVTGASSVSSLPAGQMRGQGAPGPGDLPLGWATLLGALTGNGIAVDGQGGVYITGRVVSASLPSTPGAAQPRYGGDSGGDAGGDAFVAAYAASGRLRWATYLGGKGNESGNVIAVDNQGDVYVTGSTISADFPVTPGSRRPHLAGAQNAFVARYDGSGHLRWATYLGGSGQDEGNGIAVDGQGNVYLTGDTDSTDFPVTPGAVQARKGDFATDAFVASYDRQGHLRWATFLGGTDQDEGDAIAVDGQGTVYLTGSTNSFDFPVTPGARQRQLAGPFDAFVASYDPAGRPRWATYLGGSGQDEGNGIATTVAAIAGLCGAWGGG
jgi:hypothetical protein